ncbi:hypothetical protein QBC47DRAFT_445063 [Echria macrotheca]|uniref:Uncharacterized protein n=1 Tax=Echria macrotheca TaxID=438768 RepID=A0AAJ0BEQ3_9PEZI|nr:hypothetical protein QBC47DRAFT_445063 [Echria macrotheca]
MATAIWAAYAAAIATLAAPAGLGLSSAQRFAVNKQNAFSIPVVPYVNSLYQNWNVYKFASTVPNPTQAVFTDSGQDYDTAYGIYMDNVVIPVPHDASVQAQIDATAKKMADLRVKIREEKAKAEEDYYKDCPNGVDPFTGKPVTQAEYAEAFYPEIADDQKTLTTLGQVRMELESVIAGGAQYARLVQWREALAKGATQNTSYPNFNMPVLAAEEAIVQLVSANTTRTNNQATSYAPAWNLGGNFNRVAQNWISTFPPEYPSDRRRYDQGKSSYSSLTIDITRDNWSRFNWGSATQSTGSSGWIFWKTQNKSTKTWSTSVVSINETSFRSGITVSAWGIGTFPLSTGQWLPGNPLRTWPSLVASAPKSVADDVRDQITSVVVGYGVETTFTLEKSAYDAVVGAISSAKEAGGSLSILGSLYGTSDGSSESTFESWANVRTHKENNTVVLLAHHNRVPVVLGTTITRISGAAV